MQLDIKDVADKADMIINGYAFTKDNDYILSLIHILFTEPMILLIRTKLTNLLLLSIISDIQSRFPMTKSIRKNCRSSWKRLKVRKKRIL